VTDGRRTKVAIASINDKAYKPSMGLTALTTAVRSLQGHSTQCWQTVSSAWRNIKMGRFLILLFIIVALGLPSADLFAKGRSSGSHHSPSASGTGSKSPHATSKNRTKTYVVKGNYNPNTGKRAMKTVKK
jgi:hypothetical protein